MTNELPKLPYSLHALEPVISSRTIEFHYGKHHQAYLNNLKNLLPGSPFEKGDLEEMIKKADAGIYNNAAQVWNHTFYWESLSPSGGGEPKGKLMEALEENFGSFAKFREQFSQAAATLFGSGWVWLSRNQEGKLEIDKESNAGNPLRHNKKPLLTCDVWEHAYYLDYQNRRVDYIEAFWGLIDWSRVSGRM